MLRVGLTLALVALTVFIGDAQRLRSISRGSDYYQSLPLINNNPWNSVTPSGWNYIQTTGDVAATIATNQNGPVSSPNALEIDFAGTDADSGPGTHYYIINVTEFYAEWTMKVSTDFTCSPAGCGKLAYLFHPSGGDMWTALFCTGVGGVCTSTCLSLVADTPLQFAGVLQWPPVNPDIQMTNAGTVNITRDSWFTYGLYFKRETTPGSSGDGIWRHFVNRTMVLERTGLTNVNQAFTEFQYAPIQQCAVPSGTHMKIWIDDTTLRGR